MSHQKNLSKEYLLKNIKIIEWHLTVKNGLQCSYELDGNTYFLIAEPWRLTTLLSNVYLINDRRIKEGFLQVNHNGIWKPFSWYVSDAGYDTIDLVLICMEHEMTKGIVECITDTYIAARMKPLNYN
jgi:hypothetical protein